MDEFFSYVETAIPNFYITHLLNTFSLDSPKSFDLPCSFLLSKHGHYCRLDVSSDPTPKAVLFDDLSTPALALEIVSQHVDVFQSSVLIDPVPKNPIPRKEPKDMSEKSYKEANLAYLLANSIEVFPLPILDNIAYIDQSYVIVDIAPLKELPLPDISEQIKIPDIFSDIDIEKKDITDDEVLPIVITPPVVKKKRGRPPKSNQVKNGNDIKTPSLFTQRVLSGSTPRSSKRHLRSEVNHEKLPNSAVIKFISSSTQSGIFSWLFV